MFNIFMVAEGISPWFDLTNILTAMVGCTATFVAIIGGLIANKGISDRAEKESIERQLSQIDFDINATDDDIEKLSNWINEHNAKDFIRYNIDALLDGKPLENVYDHSENNFIEYDEMLPYWDGMLVAIKLFRDNCSSEKNKEGIPKIIVEELTPFEREICSMYRNSIADNEVAYYEKCSFLSVEGNKKIIEYYNSRVEEFDNLLDKKDNLVARKQVLQDRKDNICLGKATKNGVKIFSIVSLIDIIIPVIFMLFNPTSSKVWYIVETIISFVAFIIGIIVMIWYICSLFPKKGETEKVESKGVENKNE